MDLDNFGDFLTEHKNAVLFGAGVGAFITALALGVGIHFINGEIVAQEIKNVPKDNAHLEQSDDATLTMPIDGVVIDEQEVLGDFIIPDRIIEDGADYVTLRVPIGYALYLVDKDKGARMLGVSQENGYNVYTGPVGRDLEGYVGIKDTLKYLIGAAETMNAAILAGRLEAVAGVVPEVVPGGVKVPNGYVLYHPPGEGDKGIDFIDGQVFSNTEDGIIHVEEGTSLEGYVGIPASYAQLLMSADKVLGEMEDYYNGYNAKTVN